MSEVLIIGGTGTLGQELVRQLLRRDPRQSITILSRDELKQQTMRRSFGDYKTLRFLIGDVRDRRSIERAMRDIDVIYHVAAMKHVDICEANPAEAVKTNVDGTFNVAAAALEHCVPRVIFSSTDKAVLPINVYGHTKAISERYLLSLNVEQPLTRFGVFRWGNVVGSRGSVLHRFAETLTTSRRVDITDPSMTRFWIRIEDAVRYMLSHERVPLTAAAIPTMKAAPVLRLAAAVARAVGVKTYSVNNVGMRPGEKVHEAIDWNQQMGLITSDNAPQYTDAELDDLVRPLFAEKAA